MKAWLSTDTRATQLYCSDPSFATNQAHLPVPIIFIDFGGCRGWGFENNQRNRCRVAVSAAAGACSSIECVPKQLYPSHSRGNSGSRSNQAWAPQYLVQLLPNTGSSSSRPPSNKGSKVKEWQIVPKMLLPKVLLQNFPQGLLQRYQQYLEVQVPNSNRTFRQDQHGSFGRYSYCRTLASQYGDHCGYWRVSNPVSHGSSSTQSSQT